MSESVRIVLTVFAVFRIAALIAIDDGPFDVFLRIRSVAGVYQLGADGRPARGVGRLVSCPHCIGVWIAFAVSPLIMFPSGIGDAFLTVFGVAGVASFVQSVSGREVRG